MTHTEQTVSTVQASLDAYNAAEAAVRAFPGAEQVFAQISAINRLYDTCVHAGMAMEEARPERWAERLVYRYWCARG